MSEQNLNKTIEELTRDLNAVESFWSAELRTFVYLILNLIIMIPLMLITGKFRATLAVEFKNPMFILEAILFLLTCISTSYFCFLSLVPGALPSKRVKWAGYLSAVLLLFLIGRMFLVHIPMNMEFKKPLCNLEIMALSGITFFQFFYYLKKSPYNTGNWSYAYASLAATLIPTLLMHFMCEPNYKHILMHHISPAIAFSALATYFLSRKLKN